MADQKGNVNTTDDPAARRKARRDNDPAHRPADQEQTVRVRMTADGEIGEGDQKRRVVAGTAVRVSEDEARSLVEGGKGVLADYGQSEATSGPDDDAQALQQRSRENQTAVSNAASDEARDDEQQRNRPRDEQRDEQRQ
jgi:hypothetical protein